MASLGRDDIQISHYYWATTLEWANRPVGLRPLTRPADCVYRPIEVLSVTNYTTALLVQK